MTMFICLSRTDRWNDGHLISRLNHNFFGLVVSIPTSNINVLQVHCDETAPQDLLCNPSIFLLQEGVEFRDREWGWKGFGGSGGVALTGGEVKYCKC